MPGDTLTHSLESTTVQTLWLDLTRKCQLECDHCYNASGPHGGHGTMGRDDWFALLDQASDHGVTDVQVIGGEPTLHPHGADIAGRALDLGIAVEVYSNFVHVSDRWWTLFQRPGASAATSYYSANPDEHNSVTRRPSHARTHANIIKAIQLGIPLRVGVIGDDDERLAAAERELHALGVERVGVDRVRPYGRAAPASDGDLNLSDLCGHCGDGYASVGPDGVVSPCVFTTSISVGDVRETSLAAILGSDRMSAAVAAIRTATGAKPSCNPACTPKNPCAPRCEPNAACRPGGPASGCPPRT